MPKRPKPESREERLAAAIVARVTDCRTDWRDQGGLQSPDYALLDAAGEQIGVLEVTMFTDEDQNKFLSEPGKMRFDPQLQYHWLVTLDRPRRRLKPLRALLPKTLPKLEADGVTFATTQPLNYKGLVTPMPKELSSLGITELGVQGRAATSDAIVRINFMPVDVSAGIQHATEAVEDRIEQDDNKRKLKGSWPRRELFVWIDSISRARSALSTYSPRPERVAAARPPRFPHEVTAVWAALFPLDERYLAMALWRADRCGWRVIELPEAGE